MKKSISILPFCLLLINVGYSQRKFSLYLQGQYNQTIYDATAGNNPWAMGLGFQLFFHQYSKFNAVIDLTADAYLEDDKVFRMYPDGTAIPDLGGMINFFAGASYHPSTRLCISFVGGPGFLSGERRWGIKPSIGYYFSENKRWIGKASFINIFDRDKRSGMDFGSISLSLGVRLY